MLHAHAAGGAEAVLRDLQSRVSIQCRDGMLQGGSVGILESWFQHWNKTHAVSLIQARTPCTPPFQIFEVPFTHPVKAYNT